MVAAIRPAAADAFSLLGQPAIFEVDLNAAEAAARAMLLRVHPDRFVQGTDAERRAAMSMSTRVNDAMAVLRSPVLRTQALMALHGRPTDPSRPTRLPMEFLEEQMALREAVEAGSLSADALRARAETMMQPCEAALRYIFRSPPPPVLDAEVLAHAESSLAVLQFLSQFLKEHA